MKYLTENEVKNIVAKIELLGRDLEVYILKHICGGNYEEKIIEELAKYQNDDGGFGNGLDPDFLMPFSSPGATIIALEYLDNLDIDATKNIIRKCMNYLQDTYKKEIKGWHSTDNRVNDYPHAPWWHYEHGRNYFDRSWGNLNLKIAGYLYKYRSFIDKLDLEEVFSYYINYILNNNNIECESEVYSLLSFYNNIDTSYKNVIKNKVIALIKLKIDTNHKAWKYYVPTPLSLITSPKQVCYREFKNHIDRNLDFLIDNLESKGYWDINWNWGQYLEVYERAQLNWTGYLAIKNINLLKEFDRIIYNED